MTSLATVVGLFIWILALFCGVRAIEYNSTIYRVTEEDYNLAAPYDWVSVRVSIIDKLGHAALVKSTIPNPGNVSSSFFVAQPVYISLTTMASRMHKVDDVIIGLVQARILPHMIYLFISAEPYMLDTGVTHIPDQLLCLVAAGYLQIVFTQNLGPHRKLLPALRRHWKDDVFIATVDDDMKQDQGYMILYQLLKHHVLGGGGDKVVSLRARRIGLCVEPPHKPVRYGGWPVHFSHNKTEMLLIPTGTGGILYKPGYFHEVVFEPALQRATGTADDLMFRLATLSKHIPVQLGCTVIRHRARVIRSCKRDYLDEKYDGVFGPDSTLHYKKLLAFTSEKMQRDRAKLIAEKALQEQHKQVIEFPQNEQKDEFPQQGQQQLQLERSQWQQEQDFLRQRPQQDLEQWQLQPPLHGQQSLGQQQEGQLMPQEEQSHWQQQQEFLQQQSQQTQDYREKQTNGPQHQFPQKQGYQVHEINQKRRRMNSPSSNKMEWLSQSSRNDSIHLNHLILRKRTSRTSGGCTDDGSVDTLHNEEPTELGAVEEESDFTTPSRQLSHDVHISRRAMKIPTASSKDLFTFNRKGGNDVAWRSALHVLGQMQILDFNKMVNTLVHERGDSCLLETRETRRTWYCALHVCNKKAQPDSRRPSNALQEQPQLQQNAQQQQRQERIQQERDKYLHRPQVHV